jgi:hypothetical protein
MRALILAIAVISAACSNHQAGLRDSLATLNAARDGFIAWDDAHQADLVRRATSLEQGKADLLRYRTEREKIVGAFELAYKVIATAALDPTVENLGIVLADLMDLKRIAEGMGITWAGMGIGQPPDAQPAAMGATQ